MSYRISDDFTLNKKEKIKESNTTVFFYEHKKTKASILYFQNDNESAAFGTFFKTPSENSKGTTHILEHSVFEGSQKYDQENSLDFILNSSLASFTNAMTFTDKTLYLFASSFQKDFLNLMDIYLDFVYFPKLEEKTLRKEGHFFKKTQDGYEFNGIVFNEMKNSLLSFEHKVFYSVKEFFLPGSYSHLNGGDPIEVVDLDIEELRNYHKDKYHPSNSHTIIYGKINKNKVFQKLNEVYSKFEFEKKDFEIKAIPVAEDKKVLVKYQDFDGEDNKFVKYYLLKGMNTEEDYLALDLLKKYYLDFDFSPLKRVIEDSGLCSSVESEIFDDYVFPIFTIICKGVDHSKIEALEELIDLNIYKFAKNISSETKELLYRRYEFSLKEIEFYQNQGIDIIMSTSRFLNYGLDPLIGLRNFKSLKIIQKLLKNKNFEKFLAEKFLPSQTLSIKFSPSKDLLDNYNKELDEKLKKKIELQDLKHLDREIEIHEKFLNKEKIEPKYPSLKKIKIRDLDLKVTKFDSDYKDNIFFTKLNSSDLIRTGLYFDIAGFNFSKLMSLGIYLNTVNQLGTAKYDFTQFSFLKKKYFANFSISTSPFYNRDLNKKIYLINLFLRFVESDEDKVVEILDEFILNTNFEDKERIRFLLEEQYQLIKENLAADPLKNALGKADSLMSEFEYIYYNFNSSTMLNKLKFILDNFESEFDNLASDFREIHSYIFSQKSILNLGYSDQSSSFIKDFSKKITSKFKLNLTNLKSLSNLKIPDFEKNTNQNLNFFIPSNSDTNFNVMTVKYETLDDVDRKVIGAVEPFMNQYLWDHIRVRNGAYGGRFYLDKDFDFGYFYSYSDPKINETFKIYSNTKSYFDLSKFKKYSYEKMKLRYLSGYKHVYRNSEIYNLSFENFLKSNDYQKRVSELEAKIALNYLDFKELVKKLKNIKFVVKVIATTQARIKEFNDKYETLV